MVIDMDYGILCSWSLSRNLGGVSMLQEEEFCLVSVNSFNVHVANVRFASLMLMGIVLKLVEVNCLLSNKYD